MERGARLIFAVTNDLVTDQRMQRICTTLSRAGYSVTLIGRRLPHSPSTGTLPYNTKRIRCLFTHGKLFYAEYNLRLLLRLLFLKADAVCAIDLDTILPCYICAKLKGQKMIYDAHEFFTEVPEVIRRPRIQSLWRKIEAFAVPRIPYRYTVSHGVAGLFENRYKLRFEVIRNLPYKAAAIWEAAGANMGENAKIILYQGALNEGRGLELMINAVAELQGVEFWLAGTGDIEDALRKQAGEVAPGKVHFLGRITPAALRQLTPKAFLGYNMLEDKGLSYYYSLSNKFFDYIQAGIPSLSCHFPEYKALVAQYHCGALVEYNIKDLLKNIRELLNDETYYFKLKENCHIAALELNWEKEEQVLIRFYESI